MILLQSRICLESNKLTNICKETHSHTERVKNSLRALAFNLIDLDNNQIFKDKKKINIIKNLRKDFVLLKPDKGEWNCSD